MARGVLGSKTFDVDEVCDNASNVEKWSWLSGTDFWHTRASPRHGVPSVRVTDGPNGVRGTKFFAGVPAACLPCGTALGATWDEGLLRRAGKLLGQECIAKGAHCWLGPTVNIQRSPLSGRGFESFAEDPHLSGILGSSIILGCESTGVQACPKHFVCNDQEHERRSVDTIVSERALREVYLRPFQIMSRDAQPGCLMAAYNKVNGTHVSDSRRLLTDIVREEWQWDPLIMSDWFGTVSTVQAMNAGLDLEMPGPSRWRGALGDFVQTSRMVKQSVLDARAKRVLSFVKRASQLTVNSEEGARDYQDDRDLNRKLCASSIVLLKNEQKVLPLKAATRKVALLGSHMKTPAISGGGSAALQPYYRVSLYDAIVGSLDEKETEITYEVGCYAHKMLPILSNLATTPDGTMAGGIIRFFNQPASVVDRECVGQAHAAEFHVQLMDYKNKKLNFNLFYAEAESLFIPDESGEWEFGLSVYGSARVYVDDVLIIDEMTGEQQGGGAFFGKGTKERRGCKQVRAGERYRLRVEFASAATSKVKDIGVVTFGGGGFRLGCCKRIDPETAVQRACELAADADVAILCTGLNADWESEGYDRSTMALPDGIDNLISQVLSANPSTVIITQAGTPIDMPWFNQASTVLHAWYGGNETGNGIYDCLFGRHNPSGRLPLSWPRRVEYNPSYLNFGAVNGRVLYGEDVYVGYRYYDAVAKESDLLFPFGYGLSYTTFDTAIISVSRTAAQVRVVNTGPVTGSETVQLYVFPPKPATKICRRPVKELHGFAKVLDLTPGEIRIVDVEIDEFAGSLWDEDEDCWVLEKGWYEVRVGSSSSEKDLVDGSWGWSVDQVVRWRGLRPSGSGQQSTKASLCNGS